MKLNWGYLVGTAIFCSTGSVGRASDRREEIPFSIGPRLSPPRHLVRRWPILPIVRWVYEGGALVFATALAVVPATYYWTNVPRVLLFWVAFILTRPLGATVGDFLDKSVNHGGLDLSRPLASAVIAAFIVVCLLALPQSAGAIPTSLKRQHDLRDQFCWVNVHSVELHARRDARRRGVAIDLKIDTQWPV